MRATALPGRSTATPTSRRARYFYSAWPVRTRARRVSPGISEASTSPWPNRSSCTARGGRRGGESDDDPQAPPLRPRGEGEDGAVRVRNGLDDREPEAASRRGGAGAAVEAIEYPRTLFRRNSRSRIGHGELRTGGRGAAAALHRDIDTSALVRIAHRIVDEIAQERAQRLGVARNDERARLAQAEVDAARIREWDELRHGLARERLEVHRHVFGVRAGLLARQRQHLLHQVDGALHARRQLLHGGAALGLTTGPPAC